MMEKLENTQEIEFDQELYEKNLKDHANEWEKLKDHMIETYGGTDLRRSM